MARRPRKKPRKTAPKEPSPEPLYEVETIEKAKWTNGEWRYLVKWAGYDETENTWEPRISLNSCSWMFGKFWQDVGVSVLVQVTERTEGLELTSSTAFRDRCRLRLAEAELQDPEEPQELHPGSLNSDTLTLGGGRTCLVPDPSLLWVNPEGLGMNGLTANDRYQVVKRSLESKNIDASQLLYKKIKKDNRQDSRWLSSCVICADEGKPLSGLVACTCRFKAYCLECLRSYADHLEANGGYQDGAISCPTCRQFAYIVSSTWVMLTPEEEAARRWKRAEAKAQKRRCNKLNKAMKRKTMKTGGDDKHGSGSDDRNDDTNLSTGQF